MSAKIENFDIDELCRLYRADWSCVDLAKRYSVGRMVVRNRLIERGIALRSFSESHRIAAARASKEERARRAAAAHDAVRGKRQTPEHRRKIARKKEALQSHATRIERILADRLRGHGFSVVLQKAIGPYNIDLAITSPPIAVEIFGGHWHSGGRHASRYRERTNYILDQGWAFVAIWTGRDYPLESGAVKYIVALAEKMRRGKAKRRQEHMIYGNGKPSTLGERKLNGLPVIPGPQPRDNSTGRFNPRPR